MLEVGNLYKLYPCHYLFPSKEVLKACFGFDDASEAIFTEYEGNISSIGPEEMIVLLEQAYLDEAGNIYKVLSTDGKIGWIVCSKDQFEEVKKYA